MGRVQLCVSAQRMGEMRFRAYQVTIGDLIWLVDQGAAMDAWPGHSC